MLHYSTEDQFGCLMIDLEGDGAATKSTTGLGIESVRERTGLLPQVTLVGVCGCGEHFNQEHRPVSLHSAWNSTYQVG